MCIARQDRSATGSTCRETRLNAASPDCALRVTVGVGFVCAGVGPVVSVQATSNGRSIRVIILEFMRHHIVSVFKNAIPRHIACAAGFVKF